MKKRILITIAMVLLVILTFSATAYAAPQQDCSGATLVLNPTSGPAGGSIAASGSGVATWDPSYDLYWDSPSGTLLVSGTADGSGNYSTSFNIPTDSTLGDHLVYLVATAPNEGTIICPATLTVIAAEADLGVQPDAYTEARTALPSTGVFLIPAAALLAAGTGFMLSRRRSG